MGIKLQGFLRAMSGALNPQVAQNNAVLYAQEQQDKRLREREQIKQDIAKNESDMKNAIGLVSIQMAGAQRASKAGNKKAFDEIVSGIKPKLESMGYGQGVVNKALNMASDVFIDESGDDKKSYEIHTLISPNGKTKRSFRKDDKRVPALLDKGWNPAPKETLQGKLTSSQFKERASDEDIETSLRQNITNIETLRKEYAKKDYVGGIAGEGLKMLSSAIAQYKQVTGGENLLDKDGNVNESLLDPNKPTSWIRKAARIGSKIESQQLEQAFLLAKMLNPDGKISDADVRNAYDILGKGADQETMLTLLRSAQDRQVSNENIRRQVRSKNRETEYTPLSVKGILGNGNQQDGGKAGRRKLFEY